MRETFDSIGYVKDQIDFPVLVVCGYTDGYGYTPFFIDSYDELVHLVNEFSHDDKSSVSKVVGFRKDSNSPLHRLDIDIESDVKLDGEREFTHMQALPVSMKSDFVYDVCNFMKKLHDTVTAFNDMLKETSADSGKK